MNIITESHIHADISKSWLESLPTAKEFNISIHECPTSGLDNCVETDESDAIYWMNRDDRPNLSRMVTNRDQVTTNSVVVVQCPEDGKIVVATAYYGTAIADREEFTNEANECVQWCKDNKDSFWATHALVEEN